MIENVRDYIATCPYLKQFVAVNIDYLIDKVTAYSLNEASSYDPLINESITGEKEMQFLFNFDAKLRWNEELSNNVSNSKFFEDFKNWLETNDNNGVYPEINGIQPISISATTNGYLFATDSDVAIYRISCKFTYIK